MRDEILQEFGLDVHLGMEKDTLPRTFNFNEVPGFNYLKPIFQLSKRETIGLHVLASAKE